MSLSRSYMILRQRDEVHDHLWKDDVLGPLPDEPFIMWPPTDEQLHWEQTTLDARTEWEREADEQADASRPELDP